MVLRIRCFAPQSTTVARAFRSKPSARWIWLSGTCWGSCGRNRSTCCWEACCLIHVLMIFWPSSEQKQLRELFKLYNSQYMPYETQIIGAQFDSLFVVSKTAEIFPTQTAAPGATKPFLPMYTTTSRPEIGKDLGFVACKVPCPYGPADGMEGFKKNVTYLKQCREKVPWRSCELIAFKHGLKPTKFGIDIPQANKSPYQGLTNHL